MLLMTVFSQFSILFVEEQEPRALAKAPALTVLDPGRRLSPFCCSKTQLSYSTLLRNVSIRLAAALSWACVPQRYFTRSPSSCIDGSLTTSKAGHENKTWGVDSTTNPHKRQEGSDVHFVLNMLSRSKVCSARMRNTWTAYPRGNSSIGSWGLRNLRANFLISDSELSSLSRKAASHNSANPRRIGALQSAKVAGTVGCSDARPRLASMSAFSLPLIPTCDGIHWANTLMPEVLSFSRSDTELLIVADSCPPRTCKSAWQSLRNTTPGNRITSRCFTIRASMHLTSAVRSHSKLHVDVPTGPKPSVSASPVGHLIVKP